MSPLASIVSVTSVIYQRQQLTPYVYSSLELQRLLDATSVLHSPLSNLQASTYRTMLMLLYGTGLRVGEAIRLTLHDVDMEERVLTIRRQVVVSR